MQIKLKHLHIMATKADRHAIHAYATAQWYVRSCVHGAREPAIFVNGLIIIITD
jgi:hypothetical protein